MMTETIVVAGSLAQKPRQGGHTWVFLQYLLGFRRLGWDVLFVDRLTSEQCVDASCRRCPPAASANVRHVADVMARFGLAGSYAVLLDDGSTIGLPRRAVLEHARRSALLLNVMGFLADEEILGAAPRRVFLDIDPGFPQMWAALGLADPFRGHDAFVTIGENIGAADCEIPTCGLDWITTPQPVVLDQWPAHGGGERFTSVASWRGAYGPVEYRGKTYGLRVHEFRRFVTLPRLTGEPFELALDIHPSEVRDLALLDEHGWSLRDPVAVAGDPWAYRSYIQGSRAELVVAKNMYVRARSGWLSDRSLCYLASGKPVVAQDTGFSRLYPTGEGLLAFSTLDEAVGGVRQVTREYDRHAEAARRLAEEHFDSDVVLGRLLARLGVA
jgi:hypothetical protein